jgi:hypothetical protein
VADHGNQKQPPTDQKERRSFCYPADAKKLCEIYRTTRHDLEECRTYLDCKKMPEKPATQEPHRGDHHQANPNNDE